MSPRGVLVTAAAVVAAGVMVVVGIVVAGRDGDPPPTAAGTRSASPSSPPAATRPAPTPAMPTPSDDAISLAPALRDHPDAGAVADLFSRFFGAINARDYDTWLDTLTERADQKSREQFLKEMRTTRDDQVRILSITDDAGGLQAAVSFRSHQDPAFAPRDLPVGCLTWQIAYPLARTGDGLKIAQISLANQSYAACPEPLRR